MNTRPLGPEPSALPTALHPGVRANYAHHSLSLNKLLFPPLLFLIPKNLLFQNLFREPWFLCYYSSFFSLHQTNGSAQGASTTKTITLTFVSVIHYRTFVIKKQGFTHPFSSKIIPSRSKSSLWRFSPPKANALLTIPNLLTTL